MKSKLTALPAGNFERLDIYSKRRWRRIQHIAEEFQHRWYTEYVMSLIRIKTTTTLMTTTTATKIITPPIKRGIVKVIKYIEDNCKPFLIWPHQN